MCLVRRQGAELPGQLDKRGEAAMEDRRFDDLTKALAAPTTRRQALKRLGVGLAGALAGAFGLGRAEVAAQEESKCKPLGVCLR